MVGGGKQGEEDERRFVVGESKGERERYLTREPHHPSERSIIVLATSPTHGPSFVIRCSLFAFRRDDEFAFRWRQSLHARLV